MDDIYDNNDRYMKEENAWHTLVVYFKIVELAEDPTADFKTMFQLVFFMNGKWYKFTKAQCEIIQGHDAPLMARLPWAVDLW